MARVLSTTNTQQPNNLVEYSYAEGSFIPQPPMGNTIVIVDMKGTTLHIDSHEAQRQIDEQGIEEQIGLDMDFGGLSNITKETTARDEDEDEGGEPAVEEEQAQEELVEEEAREEEVEEEMVEEEAMEEEEGAKAEAKKKKGGRQKKLTNQFNFSERAALTYNLPTRVGKNTFNIPHSTSFPPSRKKPKRNPHPEAPSPGKCTSGSSSTRTPKTTLPCNEKRRKRRRFPCRRRKS